MPIDAIGGAAAAGGLSLSRAETDEREAAIRRVAVEFEALFLAQMLDHAGLGRTPEAFGGGAGEEAFRGHLVEQQARLMAERGGIGLAESIYRAMLAREGEAP